LALERPFRGPAGVNTDVHQSDVDIQSRERKLIMAKFIFTYRQPADYVPSQTDPNAVSPWTKFFEGIGSRIVEPGQPVFERASLGEVGGSTKLAGYSVVEADSLDAALGLARGCPAIGQGGGVEVGVLAELPADHPASMLRERVASAARAR
jgi:hypothetical protein